MEIIDKYYAFSLEQHAKGSHTAISYVKALKIVDEVFLKNNLFLEQEHSIWFVNDVKRLTELYKFVKSEQKKHDGGVFRNVLSKSYWKGGFCSAAIMEFSQFLTLSARQDEMLEKFENTNDSLKLSTDLQNIKIEPNQLLIPDDISIDSLEGRTK